MTFAGTIAGISAILAGIGVLVVRYRRRDRLIVYTPLVPLGFGLVVIGLLLVFNVDLEWIVLVAVCSVIVAMRRIPLVLWWSGRISARLAAFTYAAILPVAFLALVVLQGRGLRLWPDLAIAGLLFLPSFGFWLAVLPRLQVRQGELPPKPGGH